MLEMHEFMDAIKPLEDVFGKLSPEKSASYFDSLKIYGFNELCTACRIVKESWEKNFFPTIAVIKSHISNKSGKTIVEGTGRAEEYLKSLNQKRENVRRLALDYWENKAFSETALTAKREGWVDDLKSYIIACAEFQAQLILKTNKLGYDCVRIFGTTGISDDEKKRFFQQQMQLCSNGTIAVTVPVAKIREWKTKAGNAPVQTQAIHEETHISNQLSEAIS